MARIFQYDNSTFPTYLYKGRWLTKYEVTKLINAGKAILVRA